MPVGTFTEEISVPLMRDFTGGAGKSALGRCRKPAESGPGRALHLDVEPFDPNSERRLDLEQDVRRNLVQQAPAKFIRDIANLIRPAQTKVNVLGHVGVIATGTGHGSELSRELGIAQRFERVVNGRQTERLGLMLDEMMEFIRRRMGTAGCERFVHRDALTSCAQPVSREEVRDVFPVASLRHVACLPR